jgi:lipopolysaccharide biosynthesis glycosyltransferase
MVKKVRSTSTPLTGTLGCALVCDHKLAAPAGALAKRVAKLWMIDVHVFIERGENTDAPVNEVIDDRITYHYERLFETVLGILPDHPQFTRAAWGRLFVPDFLPDYDRLIYLDVDIIPSPLTCNLSSISLPFGLGMVRGAAYIGPKLYTAQWQNSDSTINQKEIPNYFNSGVILFDPTNWDSDEVRAKLVLHRKNGMLMSRYPDQDFLSMVFEGKITELSPNLNFQKQLMGSGLISTGVPSIRHFNYDLKPFHIPPKIGAPEIACAASIDFNEMLEEAGLGEFSLNPYGERGKLFIFKGKMRKFLEDKGVKTRKGNSLRQSWNEQRSIALQYLEAGVENRVFADTFDFRLETSDIESRFNGFEVLPNSLPIHYKS